MDGLVNEGFAVVV